MSQLVPTKDKILTIRELFLKNKDSIQAALPRHLTTRKGRFSQFSSRAVFPCGGRRQPPECGRARHLSATLRLAMDRVGRIASCDKQKAPGGVRRTDAGPCSTGCAAVNYPTRLGRLHVGSTHIDTRRHTLPPDRHAAATLRAENSLHAVNGDGAHQPRTRP